MGGNRRIIEDSYEAYREFATETQLKYIDAMKRYGTSVKAGKALGVNRSAISSSLQRLKKEAARMGVSPEHGMTHAVPDGFAVNGVSTFYDREGEISRQWVKIDVDKERQKEIMKEVFAEMSKELPRQEAVAAPNEFNEALCNLVVFTDYHMGQLSWHREGGADWDLKIAEKMMIDSFRSLIQRAPKAEKGILCIQGDFLHTDGLLPLTPGHKNVLDADGRFSKIVAVAIRIIRLVIQEFLLTHKILHLIIMEGNHDEASAVWLRQMFTALYENEKRLSVNDSELPYYVHRHGEVMLAFHHGHKIGNEQLPMLFAAQYSEMWGLTKKRYAHCGHRHHIDEKEYAGMLVTQHPTLAARDAYAARGGWISERAASLITYHANFGQVSKTIVCPEMLL
jgi:hypothetical protein